MTSKKSIRKSKSALKKAAKKTPEKSSRKTQSAKSFPLVPRLIGVIHLPPLAGSPGSVHEHPATSLERAGLLAVHEARVLTQAGFDGIFIENFGDAPFYKERVPPETLASLSIIAAAVREATDLPLGINVLRNDPYAALAIAAVTGCDFIRVNVLSGVVATDQGLIEGDAARLLRERERLGVPVQIFADAHVKHARSLSSSQIGLAVEELGLRALADSVIVTGATTGRPVDMAELREASLIARENGIPLLIGSGATVENLAELKPLVHGIIVGSALRQAGRAGAPLDLKRVRDFVRAFRGAPLRRKSRKSKRSGKA